MDVKYVSAIRLEVSRFGRDENSDNREEMYNHSIGHQATVEKMLNISGIYYGGRYWT
jgi:hypothetical protein